MNPINQIRYLFSQRGHLAYGEGVTELQHALQTASLAAGDDAPNNLIVAALLHDIGHLLQKHGEDAAERGIDALHERIGAAWLAQGFGPAVTEPVRLHVEAKRYLAAREPDYIAGLSPASAQSLRLQGGPMSPAEAEAFEALPAFDAAVKLRRYDERGKAEGVTIAPLLAYRDLLIGLVSSG